jgi:DNA-binding transcriptional ArsR family regulator
VLTHLGPPVLQTLDIRKLCEVPGAVLAALRHRHQGTAPRFMTRSRFSCGVGLSGATSLTHPVFDQLGTSAARVWVLLDPVEGLTVKLLAEATKLHPSTIREALRRLESAGLADKRDGAWTQMAMDLDDLAESYGATERRQLRRKQHETER